jgi:hypothetical protein
LQPFIDKNGLLRVGGRLKHASIAYEQKHQLLLPKDHHITKLIIQSYHISHLHAGCQVTTAATRQRYWILSCRDIVRQIIFNCVRCFRVNPRFENQLMGNLPEPRVTPSRPFTHTGIDYAGPILIKDGFKRTNRKIKC